MKSSPNVDTLMHWFLLILLAGGFQILVFLFMDFWGGCEKFNKGSSTSQGLLGKVEGTSVTSWNCQLFAIFSDVSLFDISHYW